MKPRQIVGCIAAVAAGAAAALVLARGGDATDESSSSGERRTEQGAGLERLNRQLEQRGQPGSPPSGPVHMTTSKAVEDDPTSPDYDPVLLQNVTDKSVRAIHAKEPRMEGFAGEREAHIEDVLGGDLDEYFPDATLDEIDCRASSCLVGIDAPAEQWKEIYRFVQHPTMGGVQNPAYAPTDDPGIVRVTLAVLYSKEHRDHSEYEDWYQSQRRQQIAALREIGWWPPGKE